MNAVPHIVLMDDGLHWDPEQCKQLKSGLYESFCQSMSASGHDTYSGSMLKLLSDNLDHEVCISRAKVFCNGDGTAQSLASGLIWAAKLKADVVIIPLGLVEHDAGMKSALEVLVKTGCLVFASVGTPYFGQRSALYPAVYEECVAVGCSHYIPVYEGWIEQPDLIVDEAMFAQGNFRSIKMGTSTATMLAVAEYLNSHSNNQ